MDSPNQSPAEKPMTIMGCLMVVVMFVGSMGGAYLLVRLLHYVTGT